MDLDIDALIAEAREEIENPERKTIKIRLGKTLVDLEVSALDPAEWDLLTAKNPPRKDVGWDLNVGHNQDGVAVAYPVAKLKLNGNPVTAEKWQQVFSVLDPVNRDNVRALQWGLNVHEGNEKLAELGKALMGGSSKKRKPPVSSESPSSGSEGGSPLK